MVFCAIGFANTRKMGNNVVTQERKGRHPAHEQKPSPSRKDLKKRIQQLEEKLKIAYVNAYVKN